MKKHTCKICKAELSNPKHTHCQECFKMILERQALKEEEVEKGFYDIEPDRTTWTW